MAGKADETYKSGITSAQIQGLLHDPKLVSHLKGIADRGAAEANDLSTIQEAEYDTVTQNNPNTRRARVYVRPANPEARVDDAQNNTIFKATSAMRGM